MQLSIWSYAMKMEPMLLNQRNGADCFGIKQTILEHSVLLSTTANSNCFWGTPPLL